MTLQLSPKFFHPRHQWSWNFFSKKIIHYCPSVNVFLEMHFRVFAFLISFLILAPRHTKPYPRDIPPEAFGGDYSPKWMCARTLSFVTLLVSLAPPPNSSSDPLLVPPASLLRGLIFSVCPVLLCAALTSTCLRRQPPRHRRQRENAHRDLVWRSNLHDRHTVPRTEYACTNMYLHI